MSSGTSFSVNISADILNGIHPNTQGQGNKEQGKRTPSSKEDYFGVPEDILDGIHPNIKTTQDSSEDTKYKKNTF